MVRKLKSKLVSQWTKAQQHLLLLRSSVSWTQQWSMWYMVIVTFQLEQHWILVLESHSSQKASLHRVVVEGAYGGGSSKHYVQARLQSLSKPAQFVTLKFTVIPKLKKSQPPHSK